ncbi:MAG TPA: methyltransferase domain-containing protein [Pyrinomonadaceae bacterium]|jgi:SAM-dependent methyltransferase
MGDARAYAGRDLEAMAFARNYHRWLLDSFAPYLGRRLVEVGAGTGSFSELLLERAPASLALVEPATEMHRLLVTKVAGWQTTARVETYNDLFMNVAARIAAVERPDSIIYVNVLEHIADDERELRIVCDTLCPRGRVFIFVPALRWLYGSFDRLVGHERRYAWGELRAKCERAGFRVLKASYFDSAGVLPWWAKYRVLRSQQMGAGAVRFYDRFVVPPLRRLETLIPPPVGKNILLVAEKA